MPADIPVEEFEAALLEIASYFGVRWLCSNGNTVLQMLWQRRDVASTWQLFWFGRSLIKLKRMDHRWLRDHTNKIKVGDRNQRIGSLFELVAIAFLAKADLEIFAKPNTPCLDALLVSQKSEEIALSLKNFGKSTHQRKFESDARQVYNRFVASVISANRQWCGLTIFCEEWPAKNDWEYLLDDIDAIVNYREEDGAFRRGAWTFAPTSPPNSINLDPTASSYRLQIVIPRHHNEHVNLEGRISQAFDGFKRRAVFKQDRKTAMFIRVPEGAWSEQLLPAVALQAPKSHLDAVFLYQPVIATDQVSQAKSLVHYIEAIGGPLQFPLDMEFPVGIPHLSRPKMILTAGTIKAPADAYYVFQEGEIYHVSDVHLGVTVEAPYELGPRVNVHTRFRFAGDEGIRFSPRYPMNWSLTLLDE